MHNVTRHGKIAHPESKSPDVASFPGLHAQLLLAAVRRAGRRPGWIYHVMRASADVTYCS